MNSSDTIAEPPVKTTRKDKRNLIAAAAAVIVAVVVVGALMIPPPPPPKEPELKALLEPGLAVLAAGRTIGIEVSAWLDEELISPSEYDCEWHMSPYDLGTIERWSGFNFLGSTTDGIVNFTAGRNVITGNVTCIVTYQGDEATAVANITIDPPELEAGITPSDTQILVNQNTTFALVVRNSLGDTNLSYSADWSVHGLSSSDYQLNSTTGESVRFMSKAVANVTLSALVQSGADAVSCNSSVEVVTVPSRSVDYRWYDMFNVPFGEWWHKRIVIYKWPYPQEREWFTDTYPYLLQWPMYGRDVDTYGPMRLNITGRNLAETNMNERAEFLPFLGTERGGNAVIDWYMQYLTSDEIKTRYP